MSFLRNTSVASGDASADFAGPAIDASQMFRASFQAEVSGFAAAGTLKLQASNDAGQALPDGTVQGVSTWSDIPNTSVSVAIEAPTGLFILPAVEVCYRWMRVVFVHSNGTGVIVVNLDFLSY